jgi:hypothetical protein
MRSQTEALFAFMLDEAGLTWKYEPCIITLPDGRSYLPDFWVEELGRYIEIKAYVCEDNTEKARLAGVQVVTPDDFLTLLQPFLSKKGKL